MPISPKSNCKGTLGTLGTLARRPLPQARLKSTLRNKTPGTLGTLQPPKPQEYPEYPQYPQYPEYPEYPIIFDYIFRGIRGLGENDRVVISDGRV